MSYRVPVNGKWEIFDDKKLVELEKRGDPLGKWADDRIFEMQSNPLAYFLPHGRPRPDGTNDGTAFLSDWTNDLLLVTAPSQTGKTFLGVAKTALYSIPCDPSWPIFQEHSVAFREWEGPRKIIIASYSLDNVNIVWQTYRDLLPREELGQYAPGWGKFPGEKGKPKELTFYGHTKAITLKCGTEFTLLCYTQSLMHFETRQCDAAHLDEQAPENVFDGVTARQRTRGDFTPIWMTLTGYCLPGRPDTGSQGWIKRKIVDGVSNKGRKVGHYRIALEDTPDELITKQKKQEAYKQWVEEPNALHDEKKIREGLARYYGEWESGGGLVLGEWNQDIHEIAPFDLWKYKPTLYREIDHGRTPCACLLFAVMPWGDAVIFDEYYVFDLNISQNVKKIVEELCGNERVVIDEYQEEGQTWPVYQEVYKKMEFMASELDGRSFQSRGGESIRTNGMLYQQFGCTVTPSTSEHKLLDTLHQWLQLEKGRKHINEYLARPYDKKLMQYGAPRLYAFNTLSHLKAEIAGYIINPKTEKPIDKDDHLVSCMKQFTSRARSYMGDWGMNQDKEEVEESGKNHSVSSITGY